LHVCVQLAGAAPTHTSLPGQSLSFVQEVVFDEPQTPPTHGLPPHWLLLVQVQLPLPLQLPP
jgi:hypothetical protein